MKKIGVFLVFLIIAALWRPRQSLAASHPYLLFNETEISALKNKLGREPFNSAFVHLTDSADWQNMLLGASLKFLLTDNQVYFQQAVNLLNSALANPELDPVTTSWDIWDYGGWVRTYALTYDWLYQELEQNNPAILSQFQQELKLWIDKLSASSPGGLYLISGNGVPARTNGAITAYGGLGLAVLALENEVSLDSQLLMKIKQQIKINAFSLAGPEGNYQEGFHYQAFGLPKAIAFAAAYHRNKGEDIISGASLEKIINWFLYSRIAGNQLLSYADPGQTKNLAALQGEYLYLINKNQDSVAKWLWHQAHSNGVGNKPPFYRELYYPAILFWYPEALAITPPWQENYPQSFFFTDYLLPETGGKQAGLVALRNGFENNSLVLSFMNRFSYQSHQHYDPLSFTLTAYGENLAVDLMPHTYQQADRGADHEHNLVVIDLADWQTINAASQATGMAFYGRHSAQLGFIAKFFTDPVFDFTKGDGRYPYADISKNKFGEITSQYIQVQLEEITPIRKALRSIMFIKDSEHPYFIINDDLQKDNALHDYSWLFHTGFNNISGQGSVNNPLAVNTGQQSLMIYFFSPRNFSSRVINYLNHHQVIEVEKTNVLNPYFSALLYPKKTGQTTPVVSQEIGQLIVGEIVWPEAVDYCLYNQQPGAVNTTGQFTTDSSQAWLRFNGQSVKRYFAEEVNLLAKNGFQLIKIDQDKKADVFSDGERIKIKAEIFSGGRFFGPEINQVIVNNEPVNFSRSGDYVWVGTPSLKEIISRYGQTNGVDQNSDGLVNGLDFAI